LLARLQQQEQNLITEQERQQVLLNELQSRDKVLLEQRKLLLQAQQLLEKRSDKSVHSQNVKHNSSSTRCEMASPKGISEEAEQTPWTWILPDQFEFHAHTQRLPHGLTRGRGLIPRIIHQTGPTDLLAMRYLPLVRSWIINNPGWQYRYWTDADNRSKCKNVKSGSGLTYSLMFCSRALIAEVAPHLLQIYDHYPHNVQRADAVRYAILYKCVDWLKRVRIQILYCLFACVYLGVVCVVWL
jgi:hypothetical protein